jgi:hypothetical protein
MAIVRIGNEKRRKLLRGSIVDVNPQTQLSLWTPLQFGIQSTH